jgi:hypothetical protein
MTVGLCGDCVHWTPPEKSEGIPYGTCEALKGEGGYTATDGQLAYAEDVENYTASFRTMPTFGCVLFTVKPAQ